jgi:subfamily B ATP-binding cassette protein HlyB/CyaB
LVLLLRFHGISAYAAEIRHHFGSDIDVPEILRCAKEFGLKARAYRSNWRRLIAAPLQGIAVLCDARGPLVKAIEHQVLILDPLLPRPILIPRAEFEAIWGVSY